MSVLWINRLYLIIFKCFLTLAFISIFSKNSFFFPNQTHKSLSRFWDCKDIKNSASSKKKITFFHLLFQIYFERLTLSESGCKYTNFNFLIPNKFEKKLTFFYSLFLHHFLELIPVFGSANINTSFNFASLFQNFFYST